jgi:hypothetical protein
MTDGGRIGYVSDNVRYINTDVVCTYCIPYFYFLLLIISHFDDDIYYLTTATLQSHHIKKSTTPDTFSLQHKMPSSKFQSTLPIIIILLLALILVTMPANAQNPIANAYYCRMRCDSSFNLCVNQGGKSSLVSSPTLQLFILHHLFHPTKSLPSPGSCSYNR